MSGLSLEDDQAQALSNWPEESFRLLSIVLLEALSFDDSLSRPRRVEQIDEPAVADLDIRGIGELANVHHRFPVLRNIGRLVPLVVSGLNPKYMSAHLVGKAGEIEVEAVL